VEVAGVKLSSVMVAPTVPLSALPPQELDVIRRFLFQTMRGLDEDHSRRWRRMWGRVADGEVLQVYPVVERSLSFHRRYMAVENRIFDAQDGFATKRGFRLWLKLGAALCHMELHGGEIKFIPGSLSYEELSNDEMLEYHEAAMDFLRSPRALKRLWPAVKASERHLMLEAALLNPEEAQ
jgi:hypothetical protein